MCARYEGQSVWVIQCLFEHSKEIIFWWLLIYSTVQKGHKENPEQANGDYYFNVSLQDFCLIRFLIFIEWLAGTNLLFQFTV